MSTDKMIEDWAKSLGSTKTSVEQSDTGDLKGWTAGPTNEDAAQAVFQALSSHTGRRRKVWHWATIARDTLGVRRMSSKRWKIILDIGKKEGLFEVDEDSLSFPTLKLMAPESFEEDLEPEVEEVEPNRPNPKRDSWKEWEPTGGPCGPKVLDCGHFDWSSSKDHEEARAMGKCCAGWKSPVKWEVLGLVKPVPLPHRRTKEKAAGGGWPGLCCHPTTHLYIGGVGNDCRHTKGKVRCEVHGGGR